ncbi:hypothetical protein SEPCBS57363_003049 [Sporothrix epigloea]|uniref:Ureidoglycolate hydrolase n=1 Tax=Sporothrix epigloea TaxID=1892477 RepID=A0ABP0DJC5_9PEZI
MVALVPTDTKNVLADLSGVVVQPGDNPYQALIAACDNDPARIQALYSTHRTLRNAQQRAKFLDPAFVEVLVDPFLVRIENPSIDPSFADPRHGLVFWARPPEHVLQLAAHVQTLLQKAAPNGLWLMPMNRQHMTALEIIHSKTPAEALAVVDQMAKAKSTETGESGIATIANYPYAHRARLVKPMVAYDLAGVALSFVPAAGEPRASPAPIPPAQNADAVPVDDAYTYHHLRCDLFNRAQATGVDIASRYVVPSAHITLARFIGQEDHATFEARQAWVDKLDEINKRLEEEVWDKVWEVPADEAESRASGYYKSNLPPPHQRLVGEWVVGQERGLDARTGALWYGGGRSVMVGQGF